MKYDNDDEEMELGEISISGDLGDIINKALSAHIALSGSGAFSMAEAIQHAINEVSDFIFDEKQTKEIIEQFIKKAATQKGGNRKRMGKTVLRAIRKDAPLTHQLLQNAAVQIDAETFVLCKNCTPEHIRQAFSHWTNGCKQAAIRDEEIRKDFEAVLQLDFQFLGELLNNAE